VNHANKVKRAPFFETIGDHTMKKISVLGIALALAIGTAGGALAQQPPRPQQDNNDCRNGPGNGPGNCGGPAQRQRPDQNNHRPNQAPGQERNNQARGGPQQHMPPMQAQHDERGAGPNQSFHRGGRLPPEYRTRQYVVNDWRGHHLSAPPRGYHWVQNGSDYLLVAVTTGVILQILLNN
jgi:Ni/Co efflux regulator RcnB